MSDVISIYVLFFLVTLLLSLFYSLDNNSQIHSNKKYDSTVIMTAGGHNYSGNISETRSRIYIINNVMTIC